jgi:hypothetical protein
MDLAAAGGHLEVVRWLHENRSEGCTVWAMNRAAGGGFLEVIRWLHENRNEGCTIQAMDLAASGGHVEVVRWLAQNYRTVGYSEDGVAGAALRGWLNILDVLYDINPFDIEVVLISASRHGYLHVLEWVLKREPNLSTELLRKACLDALISGHLKFIRLLHRLKPECVDPVLRRPNDFVNPVEVDLYPSSLSATLRFRSQRICHICKLVSE